MNKILFPNKQYGYCVLDFETDGLSSETNNIIQIAIKRVTSSQETIFTYFIKRENHVIPDEIVRITGITNEILQSQGISEDSAIEDMRTHISGLPIIGHNIVAFDYKFLTKAFEKRGWFIPQTHRIIDTAMICKGIFANDPQEWNQSHYEYALHMSQQRIRGVYFNLKYCCEYFKIDVSDINWHRADADVEATDRLYKKLISPVL